MNTSIKISLITPCYNGASHLLPYLDSLLLSQTYTNVEYIFINDGSTDNTEEIILSYKEKIEKKGWKFIYISQENKGSSAACNAGYKIMSGVYFSQIDSDDILAPTFFEDMSDFLNTNSDVALVIPKSEMVKEVTLEHIQYIQRIEAAKNVNTFFYDCMLGINMPILPSYMARVDAFINIYPNRQIPDFGQGQNLQIYLPLALKYKFGYLDKYLLKYVVRDESVTRV